jgi:hypothetical protein
MRKGYRRSEHRMSIKKPISDILYDACDLSGNNHLCTESFAGQSIVEIPMLCRLGQFLILK